MTVKLRDVLASMPAYVPGRTVPGSIKLASNESAYPVLPHVVQRIADVAANGNRYPDAGSVQLTQTLADRSGLPADRVAVGCGSVALCQQLVQVVADDGDEVLYPWRSFEAYPIITMVAGARSVQVPLRADQSFDLGAVADALTDRTRLVFLCTPNNPTGTVVSPAELTEFLDSVAETTLVVIDEAYREFVTDPAAADGPQYLDRPNIAVLRTFSKAYGLAGLRIGYGLFGDPAVARAVNQTRIPFGVSQIAQEAALACLEPEAEKQLLARVEEVVAERSRVRDALLADGYDVPATQANFVWLPLGERTVQWAAGCEERGVIVRGFAGTGARVTVSTIEENDRFLAAAHALA
ncbi:MAG: pyridoxal phosphate-dependent aminotransferase [Jatrophihabitans sp.]